MYAFQCTNYPVLYSKLPSVYRNGDIMFISDVIISKYLMGLATNTNSSNSSGNAMKIELISVGDVEQIYLKLQDDVSSQNTLIPKSKTMRNELLKFIYNKSIRNKLVDIVTKIKDYITSFNCDKYKWNIFEVSNIPNLYIVEKYPKSICASDLHNETICSLFIYKETVLINYSDYLETLAASSKTYTPKLSILPALSELDEQYEECMRF
jgi:hypothetical protein